MNDVLKKVEQIALMADISVQLQDELLTAAFDMGDGREQHVYIGDFGEAPNGMHIVVFVSPCLRHEGGWFRGMSRDQMLDLLRRNGNQPFANFALMEIAGEEFLVVSATQLLETMEVQEFQACCQSVVSIADGYEKELGKDEF